MKLKPRKYVAAEAEEYGTTPSQSIVQRQMISEMTDQALEAAMNPFKYEEIPHPLRPKQRSATLGGNKLPEGGDDALAYSSSEHLRMGQRGSLDRFKPLTLNGTTMTEATIGGYKLDMIDMARRAAEVVPLPAVALPLIFRDTDLNFCHHFFNGLDILAGQSFIDMISKTGRYSADDRHKIAPLVKQLVSSGYEESDEELVIFIKRVLSTTFEISQPGTSKGDGITFLVVSNFYGFQYIETGMLCREQDLKMWLHSAYVHYRTLWFNAFKSSGIPSFALEGVQDRYAQKQAPTNSDYDKNTESKSKQRNDPEVQPLISSVFRHLETVDGHSQSRHRHKEKHKSRH